MRTITVVFFELIQIAVERRDRLNSDITEKLWPALYEMASKQSLTGVLLNGLDRLLAAQRPPQGLLFEWIGAQQFVISVNKNQDNRSKALYEWFNAKDYRCCIIKGQGVARLYPQPELRQAGDIDIW